MKITYEIERLIFMIEMMDDIYDSKYPIGEMSYLTFSELKDIKKLMDDNQDFFKNRYDDAQYLYNIISDKIETYQKI